MWPLTKVTDEQVLFCVYPEALVGCWLQKTGANKQLQLKAYKKFDLDSVALTPTTIADPTLIMTHIRNFLRAYNLGDARVTIGLTEPHISQEIITLPYPTPKASDMRMEGKKQIAWDYYYLYPTQDNKHAFYTCAINQSLLLQYTLLATRADINLSTVTTQHTALFNAYRYLYGSAFRASQLAVDMERCNSKPEQLFTHESLRRLVSVPVGMQHHAQGAGVVDLLSACGLFIMGDEA